MAWTKGWRRTAAGLACAFALGLAGGCGGTAEDELIPIVFRGSWTGTWSDPVSNDSGTIAFTIFNDGSLVGTMTSSVLAANAPLTGQVEEDGDFDAVAGFGASGNFVMRGTLVLTSGRLLGSFDYRLLGQPYAGSLSMVKGAAGGGGGAPE